MEKPFSLAYSKPLPPEIAGDTAAYHGQANVTSPPSCILPAQKTDNDDNDPSRDAC